MATKYSPVPAYNVLRQMLASIEPAAGPDGFEGLVTTALSSLSGLTFRLAKSGSQFGRDASSSPGNFAIAMEAKRYSSPVRLQELAGKVALTIDDLSGNIDLWVLAATVEIGENDNLRLRRLLENTGIALLTLDWASSSLPRLAVLLAAAQDSVANWLNQNSDSHLAASVCQELSKIRADSRYADICKEVLQDITAADLGLDALRLANKTWAIERFSNADTSQRTFNQFLAPLDEKFTVVERTSQLQKLRDAIDTIDVSGNLIALLGPEGVGKSWLIAQWWSLSSSPPILLLSAGRLNDGLRYDVDAIDIVAKLIAKQTGSFDDQAVARWKRRLENWSASGATIFRFCMVIDGLNESSGKAWVGVLRNLTELMAKLGGFVIVTSREGFWRREVLGRGGQLLSFVEVLVDEYDDLELTQALRRTSVSPEILNDNLRNFLKNPRICSLAVNMLEQLASIEQLTVDRLLFEYWRHRLIERGDLVGHDDNDFAALLKSHARSVSERPTWLFNRDNWQEYSSATRRNDGRNMANDLSDIEEGRFFKIENYRYQFQEKGLNFALGLLIADELRSTTHESYAALCDALESITEPVRSFDAFSDILAAAVGIACLDQAHSDLCCAVLINAWLALQNRTKSALESFPAYIIDRPNAFLEAYEIPAGASDHRLLMELIVDGRSHLPVATAIGAKINRWLGSWSRASETMGRDAEQSEEHHRNRTERIVERLSSMTEAQSVLFESLCPEFPQPIGLAGTAALLMIGKPQLSYAQGIAGFAMVSAIASDFHHPFEDVAWSVRLNREDFEETYRKCLELIEPFGSPESSEISGKIGVTVLRLFGTVDGADKAEAISPATKGTRWRRVDQFCDTDPRDPSAAFPSNLENARSVIETTDPTMIWLHMSSTSEDHDMEMVRCGLARFDYEKLTATYREIVQTGNQRSGLALRQLSWRLPWLSPLFDPETVQTVVDSLNRLIDEPDLLNDQDFDWICGCIASSLLPHFAADQQLELLLRLPEEVPGYLKMRTFFKPLEETATEAAIKSAEASPDPRDMERTLFFLSANTLHINDVVRASLIRCLSSEAKIVAGTAYEIAIHAEDAILDEAVIASAVSSDLTDERDWLMSHKACAFANAVVRRNRADLLCRVTPAFLGFATSEIGGESLCIIGDAIEQTINRLGSPIATPLPPNAEVTIEIDSDDARERIMMAEKEDTSGDLESAFERMNERMSDVSGEAYERRMTLLADEVKNFIDRLTIEGALSALYGQQLTGLAKYVAYDQSHSELLLQRILTESNPQCLRQMHNVGLSLACAYSAFDSKRSAQVFNKLWPHPAFVNTLIGDSKISLRYLMLFSAKESADLNDIKVRAFKACSNDASIEEIVAAAETTGKADWLDEFVSSHAKSEIPADQALALTVSGLRDTNSTSKKLFALHWGTGFLGAVAENCQKYYERNEWSHHWYDEAIKAQDAGQYWRSTELATACSDRRALLWADNIVLQSLSRAYGGEIREALAKRAEKVTKKRDGLLFGQKKPGRDMLSILHDS